MDLLELAGDTGEGGGQILRTALFLSLVTGRPFRATRIRAGRPKPGLKAQHATIVRALHAMTGAKAEGATVGSTTMGFTPGRLQAGAWSFDVGTAGAIPLVLQTLLPVCVAAPGPTRLTLRGGTDVPFAPTIDWVRWAYAPYLSALADIRIDVPRRGFAPEGGGLVEVEVVPRGGGAPGTLDGLRAWTKAALGAHRNVQGTPLQVMGSSLANEALPPDIPRRQAIAAHAHTSALGAPVDIAVVSLPSDGVGTSITLCLVDSRGNRLGSDRLGARGRPAETVGRIAAEALVEDWRAGATVDRHLADHVVPWVALGAGAVKVPHETPHLTTNAWVCNEFLGDKAVRVDRNLIR